MTTTLAESARLAGGHAWLERRLFEITGGWVTSTPEPEAKLLLDRHSHHHAWRARQWEDRLPVLADVDRAALIIPADPALARALDRLAGPAETDATATNGPAETDDPAATSASTAPPGPTPVRLAGLYRFALPRLWVAYDRHARAAGPAADGSSLRTLAIVAADVTRDWQEGEAVLQNLLDTDEAVAAAASTVGSLESAALGR